MAMLFFELSKYIMVILITLYTYECFAVFRYENPEERGGIYIRQNILMFAIHFIGFAVIVNHTKDLEYFFYYLVQLIVMFGILVLFRTIYPYINRLIVNNMCMLLCIGFLILTRLSREKAIKQFVIVAVSFVIALIIPWLLQKLKEPERYVWIYAGLGISALALVYFVGAVTNGSKISFAIAGFRFQPSEFVKILYVFFLAALLAKRTDFRAILLSAIGAGIHVIFLTISKDLGSALIFFIVYIMILFVATKKVSLLLLGFLAGAIAAVVAYQLFSHVQVRVEAWLIPFNDISGTGYQITQSLFAIGTGGWFGLGLYGGTPASIPYVEADFIFSAIAEELGVIFAICVILICTSCFLMFMNIAMKMQHMFYQLVAIGLGVTYGFQIFLTIGGGTKLIPLTGVTLPLISYGGTSVLTTLIMFSIIQGFYIIRKEQVVKQDYERKKRKKAEE